MATSRGRSPRACPRARAAPQANRHATQNAATAATAQLAACCLQRDRESRRRRRRRESRRMSEQMGLSSGFIHNQKHNGHRKEGMTKHQSPPPSRRVRTGRVDGRHHAVVENRDQLIHQAAKVGVQQRVVRNDKVVHRLQPQRARMCAANQSIHPLQQRRRHARSDSITQTNQSATPSH